MEEPWEQEGSRSIGGCSPQVTFQQCCSNLFSHSGRPGVGESLCGRGKKKGNFKYLVKGKTKSNLNASFQGDIKAKGATNREKSKLHSKRETRHLKPACSTAQEAGLLWAGYRTQIKARQQETQGTSPLACCQHCLHGRRSLPHLYIHKTAQLQRSVSTGC